MIGRSIEKHPNPSGIVNTVIDGMIASRELLEINASVTVANRPARTRIVE